MNNEQVLNETADLIKGMIRNLLELTNELRENKQPMQPGPWGVSVALTGQEEGKHSEVKAIIFHNAAFRMTQNTPDTICLQHEALRQQAPSLAELANAKKPDEEEYEITEEVEVPTSPLKPTRVFHVLKPKEFTAGV
jgi:hypothetical protein